MPVFHKNGFYILHVHVPKTGGGSILELFQGNGFDVHFSDRSSVKTGINSIRSCSPQHYHAGLIRQTLRLERLNYIFLTVRHPIDRIKSEFIWRNRGPKTNASPWINRTLDTYKSDKFIYDNHIRPQKEFWIEGADVIKSESDVISEITERLRIASDISVDPAGTGNAHVSSSFSVKTVNDVEINAATERRVRDFYQKDFEFFGYSA